MLSYLSKFVLQMLPTIAATVIGAYIVATWINPRTPSESARIAAGAPRQQAATLADPVAQPADKAASAPETVRVIPIVKQPALSQEAAVGTVASPPPVVETTAAADDRRDANTLARAAIQRQRADAEAERVAEEPAKPASPVARPQQARSKPDAPPPSVAAVAPPLPPAITIAPLRSPQGDAADERPNPPAEIPTARNPLSLQASHRVADNPSPADDFLNATRSFFRALTPQ
jgi:hypothetical protein